MGDITSLFNDIAPSYDKLNHLLSWNVDKFWRKRALSIEAVKDWNRVLDVACGTADFSLQLAKKGVKNVVGIDLSEKMLEIGDKKVKKEKLQECIKLQLGDCKQIQFPDCSFDAVTVAFGVRNFACRTDSLREMLRVLKLGGHLVILEFSTPQKFPFKQFYRFYFQKCLPFLGGAISGNRSAYDYLPQSVYAFPQGKEFMNELQQVGFVNVVQRRMTLGIVTVYYAQK